MAWRRSYLPPVLPIGAGLAVEDHSPGWRVATSETRAQRAPLTVIFARPEDARHEEDGPVRCAGAVTGQRYGPGHRPAGAGPPTGVAPVGLPPGRARQGAAPQSVGCPPPSGFDPGWRSVCQSGISPNDFALLRPDPVPLEYSI